MQRGLSGVLARETLQFLKLLMLPRNYSDITDGANRKAGFGLLHSVVDHLDTVIQLC